MSPLTIGFLTSVALAPVPDRPSDLYGDPLPPGAIARIGTIRLRNSGEISRLALSPDGKLLATVSHRGIRLWNAKNGAFVKEIELPFQDRVLKRFEQPQTESVIRMAFPAGSRELYVFTGSGTLRMYDLSTEKWTEPLARTTTPSDEDNLSGAFLSPDRTVFFFSQHRSQQKEGENFAIEVFKIGKERPILRIDDPRLPEWGRGASATADNGRAAILLKDGSASVWDLNSGKMLHSYPPPEGRFYHVSISPDGETLVGVCGPENNRFVKKLGMLLHCWDVKSGKVNYQVQKWESYYALHSPDGSRLIGEDDGDILVADAGTGKRLHRLKGHGSRWISGLDFSADGKRLVTGGSDHTAIIWDLVTGKPALDFASPRGPVDVIRFSPDGRTLFTGCADDHPGALWDAQTGRLLHRLVADEKGNPLCAAFTRDGRLLVGYGQSRATGTGNAWTARLWNVLDGKLIREFGNHTNGVHQLAVSHDGKQFATRDWGKKVRLWELDSSKPLREFDWVDYPTPVAMGFSKDGELLGASATRNQDTEVSNLLSGRQISSWKGKNEWLLAFSPDGSTIAVGEYPREYNLRLRSAVDGKVIHRIPVEVRHGTVVAFSQDGKQFAVSGFSHVRDQDKVQIYDVASGEIIRTISGHQGMICGLAFSPDGKRLATGSWDSTALVWDLTTKP